MTPKSLLRHPLAALAPRDLADGRFRRCSTMTRRAPRIGRPSGAWCCAAARSTSTSLASDRRAAREGTVAICRVEQLYPFPAQRSAPMLDAYPQPQEIVWVQEEPENMGAWDFVVRTSWTRPAAVRVALHRAPAQREPGRGLGRRATRASSSASWRPPSRRRSRHRRSREAGIQAAPEQVAG